MLVLGIVEGWGAFHTIIDSAVNALDLADEPGEGRTVLDPAVVRASREKEVRYEADTELGKELGVQDIGVGGVVLFPVV